MLHSDAALNHPDAAEQSELVGALRELTVQCGTAALARPSLTSLPLVGRGKEKFQNALRAAFDAAGLLDVVVDVEIAPPPGEGETESTERTARFLGIARGLCRVELQAWLERDDVSLQAVATQLATTAWRIRHGLVKTDGELEPFMAEVTSVYLGFGPLAANASLFRTPAIEGASFVSIGALPVGHVNFILAVRTLVAKGIDQISEEFSRIHDSLNDPHRRQFAEHLLGRLPEHRHLREIVGVRMSQE